MPTFEHESIPERKASGVNYCLQQEEMRSKARLVLTEKNCQSIGQVAQCQTFECCYENVLS